MKRRLNRQLGYLMLEAALAMAVSGVVAFYQLKEKQASMLEDAGTVQGEHIKKVGSAANAFAVTYYSQVLNNTAITGVANPRAPTVTELAALGFLPQGFANRTLNGGAYLVSFTLAPSGCTVNVNCQITGHVVTTTAMTFGGQLSQNALGAAVIAAGADAGASATTGATISGTNGSWTLTNPVGGQPKGILAMRVGADSIEFSQFLRRDGALAMTGPLNMGGQNITNAAGITGSGNVNTTGGGYQINGTTVIDSSRNVSANNITGANVTATGTVNSTNGYQVGGTTVIDSGRNLVNLASVYSNDWFRNNTAGYGLYNQATGNHLYSESANYWVMSSAGQASGGLRLRQGHAGTTKGYLYYDASGFGLLSGDGNWRVRTAVGTVELYGTTYASDVRSNIFYDRDNTAYYLDPASTSNLNRIDVADVRSSIYYDKDNTSYYLDPASTSNLNVIYGVDVYANSWLRNVNSGTGLYNQATGTHWYSDSNGAFNLAGNGSVNARIIFRDSHNSTVRGYVYTDSSGFGLLSSDGQWRVRTSPGYQELYGITYASDVRSSIYYDRDNTAYYLDPAGTNRVNYIDADSINSRGAITAAGTISGAYLRPTTVATVGAACAQNGLLAQDSTGLTLSCQSGQWRRDPSTACSAGNVWSGGGCVSIASYASVPSGTLIAGSASTNPVCPSGTTLWLPLEYQWNYYYFCRKN